MPPLILHTILLQYFQWWKCENLTAQSEQYCAEAIVKSRSIGRCRYSLVSTAATVSTHFIIFLNPFIFLRCLRWTYTMLLQGEYVLSFLPIISKSRIPLLVSPSKSVSKLLISYWFGEENNTYEYLEIRNVEKKQTGKTVHTYTQFSKLMQFRTKYLTRMVTMHSGLASENNKHQVLSCGKQGWLKFKTRK